MSNHKVNKVVSIESLKPHVRNANKGSERGSIQIEESLKAYGAGRSVLLDKNDIAIAGNHVMEGAVEVGIKKVIVVETDGDTLVAVKRTDLDLSDPKDRRAVELAVADNRTRDVSAGEYDREVIEAELRDGADFSKFFREDELEALLKGEQDKEKKAGQQAAADEMTVVKLVFTPDQVAEFNAASRTLMVRWGLQDSGAVVLEAMRRAQRG